MLRTIRRHHSRRLASANREWLNGRLDNIAWLSDEIRALPAGASAVELAEQMLREAEYAVDRARCADDLTAKSTR